MGFLQAMQQMGQSEQKEGLEPYLVRPMSQDGKEIRVWLKVNGDLEETLDIVGVSKIDLADYKSHTVSLKKYLYKKPPSNTTASFTPVYIIPKAKVTSDPERNRSLFCPEDWEANEDAYFFKIKSRILDDYERQGVFAKGSVDLIFKGMIEKIDAILSDLERSVSYIMVFVIDDSGNPLYPGEIPALEKYFVRRLEQSLSGNKKTVKKKNTQGNCAAVESSLQNCSVCGRAISHGITLNQIFKFATFDKLSFLPGLDEKEIPFSYAICQECYEQVASGREKVDRVLTKWGLIPDIFIWAIPESVGNGNKELFTKFLNSWEERFSASEITGADTRTESKYFSRLAAIGQGLIFHFVFWEPNNSQEIVHLMVEDVPPERLARLERVWQMVIKEHAGWNTDTDLDMAIRSLYGTLKSFAGKSKADKRVFQDFALKIIGKMLMGERVPVEVFKQMTVTRLQRLVYESNEAALSMRFAEIWVEYMNRINQEVTK